MIDKCYIIPVEKACNCDCTFCISKSRNYNKGNEFLEINAEFIKNLELLKVRGIRKFEITGGGEPFLHKDIDLIVRLIKTIIPDSFVKIYTNGTIDRKGILADEINISVVHQDPQINDKFMRPNVKGLNLNGKLCNLINHNPGVKVRLSVPLIKGGIDSPKKLKEFIKDTGDWHELVVRTLYPGCPGYEENYVDFDYKGENVIFERDNNVGDFSGLIYASDGKLYTDWNLDTKRHLYSYLLLKPDARTYINEIDDLIREKNFNVMKRLLVNDFVFNATRLYQDKTKEYLEIVKRHLLNSAYLFGNTGLVYVLDKGVSLEELLRDTFNLKKEIRNRFGFTENYNGYVNFNGEDYHLNLVHAPDPEIDFYNRDLNIIRQFSEVRELTESEFGLVKKYRSFTI